tara:strand:+ start:741 stop:866 length:126 start_codon:yes stop_codon:yes gene_type:complete
MTVSRLRTELTDAELVHFAAFYEVKAENEEKAIERAKRQRR